jgi:hypothetical protein
VYPQLPRPMSVAKLAAKLGQNRTNGLRITISDKGLGIRGKENGIAIAIPLVVCKPALSRTPRPP